MERGKSLVDTDLQVVIFRLASGSYAVDIAAVREIIRRRAQLADQPLGNLSAHSLRSGFVTEAGKQGISLGETMTMTGHRSVQTVMGYYQSGELSTSRAARLIEGKT